MNELESDGHWRRVDWYIIVFLFAATLSLYLRAAGFKFLDYDDDLYVSRNAHVLTGLKWSNIQWAMTAIVVANWHPLTLLAEMSIASVFGANAGAFHLVNAAIHSVNVALLFAFLFYATRLRWPALMVAMLWGWHPLRIESVAWIAELKDVLCGFFWLSCMLAYLQYRRRGGWGWYSFVILTLGLALLSKPMAVTLPFVLLLLDFWPIGLGAWTTRIVEKIPLLGLSVAAGVMAWHTQRGGAAIVSLQNVPLSMRLANAVVSYVAYLEKSFLPIRLAIFYPHPAMLHQEILAFRWIFAGVVLLLITACAIWRRRTMPYLLGGWLWFLGTLVPVIGLFQVGEQAMADRYSYLPTIGLTFAIVWCAADLLQRRSLLQVGAVAGAAVCLALAIGTVIQLGYWRNTQTVFGHANEAVPNNYRAKVMLAAVDLDAGRNEEAFFLARSAVSEAPLSRDAQHTLALALAAVGKTDQAIDHLKTLIHLDPNDANLHNDLGGLFLEQGKTELALSEFQSAVRLDPSMSAARHNQAILLAGQGHFDQAIEQWRYILKLEPKNGLVHGWLGEALRMTGDRAGALAHYRAAVAAGQHNPKWEMNLVWYVATDPSTTPDQAEDLLPIAKDAANHASDVHADDALAALLARTGRFDDAVAAAQRAIDRARSSNQMALVREIQMRLSAYRAGRVYLEK